MFFTRAGFVIAWLLFLTGALGYASILLALMTGNEERFTETLGSWFFASASTFVEMIGVGIAFGIAAEISHAVTARDD